MASRARRLIANVDGDFFVDDSCIDCGACRWIAPGCFDAHGGHARVYYQPECAAERSAAVQALVSCPTGSIGGGTKAEVTAAIASFPRRLADNVYHAGFHSEDSFGAASYLVVRPAGNVLVDSPRFHRGLVKRIEALGGVRWMFLTHRDDVADHERFVRHFGCRRVMHRRDVSSGTRAVEEQIAGDEPFALADDLLVIPTPGHTAGSACLLYAERFLFSGDHVAFSRRLGQVYAFWGACWYDWPTQIASMERLTAYRFEHILPGHGAPCSFPAGEMRHRIERCVRWMRRAA